MEGNMRSIVVVIACILLAFPRASAFQSEPETLREQLDTPEFAKTLREILAVVKIGTVAQINPKTGAPIGPPLPAAFIGITSSLDLGVPAPQAFALPAAGFCIMSQVFYRCQWETKPNKYSVAVLQDFLSASAAAALPNTWKREKGQTDVVRYTDFTDPTGEIAITVSCAVSERNAPLSSYAAKLTIHRAELQPPP
jgi:hypothetical protein